MLKLAQNHAVLIYEATLLIETGRYRELHGLIVIESSKNIRLDRLVHRDGHSIELAEKIIQSQIPDEERRKYATVVIENDGTLEELKSKLNLFACGQGWKK